jgi:hypothetical protein
VKSDVFASFYTVLYVLWLIAGAIDYLCHRRTHIQQTSGQQESLYHVAQFVVLGIALVVGMIFAPSVVSLTIISAAVLGHTVLGYLDVAYTTGRRHITPLEQTVHGFMDVIPLVLVLLYALVEGSSLDSAARGLHRSELQVTPLQWWVLGSYVLIAGGAIVEEFVRIRIVRWVWPPLNRTRR